MEEQLPQPISADAIVYGPNNFEQEHEGMHPAIQWYVTEQNEHQAVVRVILPDDGEEVKEEEKTEDVKEEPTVVSVQVPDEEDYVPLPPKPLGAGEIPILYSTVEARKELLDEKVRSSSMHNQGVRFDILTKSAQSFIEGNITGFFESHLLHAMYTEVRAVNKRTARRRTRRQKKINKRLRRGGVSKN